MINKKNVIKKNVIHSFKEITISQIILTRRLGDELQVMRMRRREELTMPTGLGTPVVHENAATDRTQVSSTCNKKWRHET